MTMAADLETLNAEIDAFNEKHKNLDELKTPEGLNSWIADAEEIIAGYPYPEGDVKKRIAKFYNLVGDMTIVFGDDLERGVPLYHKSLELDPENDDLYWGYYTTLEEIVDNDKLRTPALVDDAVMCLETVIGAILSGKRPPDYLHFRYVDLGRVYLADHQYDKAKECFEKSLAVQPNDAAQKQLKIVNKKLGDPFTRFFKKLFSVFRGKK